MDRHAFVAARHIDKHKLKQAHNRYTEEILGLTNTNDQSDPKDQATSNDCSLIYASKEAVLLTEKLKAGF